MIRANAHKYCISALCRCLGIARSTYYYECKERQDDNELEEAVRAAKDSKQPVRLLVKEMDVYRTLSIDYHDGLRYPTLERIEGKADYLTPIFTARK